MRTSIILNYSGDNPTTFTKHKFFVVPDPAFDIASTTSFLLEGKVKRVSSGINEEVGVAELEFPKRVFGEHIGFMTPFAVIVNNADNVIFRGFLCEEDSVLSVGDDSIYVRGFDYKWFLGEISKIHGKIYTVDNHVRPDIPTLLGVNDRVYTNPNLFEKFRYTIPNAGGTGDPKTNTFNRKDATGYVGRMKTIFNENGNPDAAGDDLSKTIAFKFDADKFYSTYLSWKKVTGNVKYWWNFSTILSYIARYYIDSIFEGFFGSTKVAMNYTGLTNIIRFGEYYGMDTIIPRHFDITGLSPVQAIDKVVKAIPGTWFWRLLYFQNSVYIDIQNLSDPLIESPGKVLHIGTGQKINAEDDKTSVASIKVTRSIKDSVSQAVAVGGALEIETTIQYYPGWPQYLRPLTDISTGFSLDFDDLNWELYDGGVIPDDRYISNFKNPTDYYKWVQYLQNLERDDTATAGKLKQIIVDEDEIRYAKIFRVYVFPEYKFHITKFSRNAFLSNMLPDYESLASYLDELIFTHAIIPRKIKGPVTNWEVGNLLDESLVRDKLGTSNNFYEPELQEHSLFVFLYDSQIGTTVLAEKGNAPSAKVSELLDSKKFIIPGNSEFEDRENINFSFQRENRVLIFDSPQFEKSTISFQQLQNTAIPSFFEKPTSRAVFVSCRIEADVPIVQDSIVNRDFYGNARLVKQEINDELTTVIRTNAFYPTPEGFIGDEIIYTKGTTTQIGTLTTNRIRSREASSSLGSKLIDWNVVNKSSSVAAIVWDDRDQLKQLIRLILGNEPLYSEEMDVEFGIANTSFIVGDKIEKIVGSELDDGTGGFFNLKALITRLEYSQDGESDALTSRCLLKNNIVPTMLQLGERRR